MEIDIKNKLSKSTKLCKAFSNIPAEKFAEFYSKIVSKDVLDDVVSLNVEIGVGYVFGHNKKEMYCSFKPEFENSKQTPYNFGTISRVLKNKRLFDLFNFIPSEFSTYTYEMGKEKITALWQQFLTENLGENFYRTLLAQELKVSLDKRVECKNKEYDNLIVKLAQIEQEKAALQKESEKLEQEYADVLHKKPAQTGKETEKTDNTVETTETQKED